MAIFAQIARLVIVKSLINLPLREYFFEVVLKGFVVVLFASFIPCIVYKFLPENIYTFGVVVLLCFVNSLVMIYLVGLSSAERTLVQKRIQNFSLKK